MKVNFKPSTTVEKIVSGRVRDDSFDAPVSEAYKTKGKVYEAQVSAGDVEEYRKGLQRSALFLGVRVATDFEENGDGSYTVRFSAHDKMARNGSRKATVESADAPDTGVETASVSADAGKSAKK